MDCILPSRPVQGSWQSPRRALRGPRTVANTEPSLECSSRGGARSRITATRHPSGHKRRYHRSHSSPPARPVSIESTASLLSSICCTHSHTPHCSRSYHLETFKAFESDPPDFAECYAQTFPPILTSSTIPIILIIDYIGLSSPIVISA